MNADPEVPPKSDFRQGRRVHRNVYHGDEPLFMAATEELAAELVIVLNAGAAALRASQKDGAAASGWRPISEAPVGHGQQFLAWSRDIGPVVCERYGSEIVRAWDHHPYEAELWAPILAPLPPLTQPATLTETGGRE